MSSEPCGVSLTAFGTDTHIAPDVAAAAAVEALAAEARNTALLASLKASPLLRLRPVVEEPPPSEEAEGGSVTDSAVDEDQVSTGEHHHGLPASFLAGLCCSHRCRLRCRHGRGFEFGRRDRAGRPASSPAAAGGAKAAEEEEKEAEEGTARAEE